MFFFWKKKKPKDLKIHVEVQEHLPGEHLPEKEPDSEPKVDYGKLFSDLPHRQASNLLVEGELTPVQILLLSYYESLKVGAEPARFWETKYGIEDIQKELLAIEEKGFADGEKLTEKGEAFADKHEWVLYIHRQIKSNDITMEGMAKRVNENPRMKWQDLMWGYFNENLLDYGKRKKVGLERNTIFNMAYFLEVEESKPEKAIQFYADALFYDLNGFPMPTDPMRAIAPGLVEKLRKMEKAIDYTDEQLIDLFHQRFAGMQPKYKNYSVDAATYIATCYAMGYDDRSEALIRQLHPAKE